jgi:hypothetical protein
MYSAGIFPDPDNPYGGVTFQANSSFGEISLKPDLPKI